MAGVPQAYLEDASGLTGSACEFAAPSTAEQLSAILADCSRRLMPVTFAGAGTGLVGGRIGAGGMIVSLEHFRRLEIHPGHAIAGAGVSLKDLHTAAQGSGQFYPPDPTEWTASVGGTIATNASGSRSFLYGSTRKWIRSLTAVFIDGSIRTFRRGYTVDFPFTPLPAPRARKHTAGYPLRESMDWIDLLCGSEGTLAAVVEAELSLLPQPASLLSGVVFFPSPQSALAAVDSWRPIAQLRMLEYLDNSSLRILSAAYKDIPATAQSALLIEQQLDALPGDPIGEWIDRLDAANALAEQSWFGETAQDRERFRALRHSLPEVVNDRVHRNGFPKLNTDYAVPIEASQAMLDYYVSRLDAELPGRYAIFGHIGDAHVHVNMLPESQADFDTGLPLTIEFARHAVSLGGTVSAEHGLGRKKRDLLAIEFSDAQIEAMRAVKRRLDPVWLLGQGVLFDPEEGRQR
ncbi:MAG: FAD-binding oxidoreductase [Bryobacteraceae bacterium]|nr:FAD-binding oxidoreductase [Bryobacteraceae bacterium]